MTEPTTTTPSAAPAAGGSLRRVLTAGAATLGAGAATALAFEPSHAGAQAATVESLLAAAPAWAPLALAGATGLAGLRLLWAMKPRAERAAPEMGAANVETSTDETAEPVADEPVAEPPRRAVQDPSAVFPSYSAAPASMEEGSADVIPFPETPAVTADPAAEAGWAYDEETDDAPATIRFEDVPSSVRVGSRRIDLTEVGAGEDRSAALKGLTKKEKRTVRKALRDRERLLRRAA